MHKLVHTRLDLSYPDLTRLRGGRDGSNKFDRPPATGTATPGSSGQGRPDGPPRPGLLWLDQGEHPIALAYRLGVTRVAVYSWARRLRRGGDRPPGPRVGG